MLQQFLTVNGPSDSVLGRLDQFLSFKLLILIGVVDNKVRKFP
jgi:hypothetical protein